MSFSICTPKRGSARRRPREGRQVSGKRRARAARRWSERRQAAALWGRRPYRRLADQSISPARKPSLARPAMFGIGIAVVDGPQHLGQGPIGPFRRRIRQGCCFTIEVGRPSCVGVIGSTWAPQDATGLAELPIRTTDLLGLLERAERIVSVWQFSRGVGEQKQTDSLLLFIIFDQRATPRTDGNVCGFQSPDHGFLRKEHVLVEEIGLTSHRAGSLRRRIHLCLAISSLTPPTANSRQPPKPGPCRPAAVARPVGRRDALLTLYNRNSGLDASTFQDSIGTCHASRQRFFAISTVSNQ